jgi:uncharacterized protein
MLRVAVTGATGFIGRAVVAALQARGDAVTALTRDPSRTAFPPGVRVQRFDPAQAPDPKPFEDQNAVIHLAGETVAGRWTAEKKKAIRESRVAGTRNLIASLRASARHPQTLVSASAVGYYGSRGDEPLEESAAPGDDFLAQVCVAWEREARAAASDLGMRVALLRQGIVFGADGGALEQMLVPFRWFVGGPLGNGGQWFPWIHLADDVALILFALDRSDITGPVNAVSPDIATNARVSAAIGHALTRPSLAYAPSFALHAVLGEFASSVLASQLVLPARASDAGFAFKHENLETALLDILAPGRGKRPATNTLDSVTHVRGDRARAFALYSDAGNLPHLTEQKYGLQIVLPQPIEMRRGATIEYRLRVRSVPVRWKSLITEWRPDSKFVDYQVRGPFALWRHEHRFIEEDGGVRVEDSLGYSLPLAPLSGLVLPLVRADLAAMFEYRKALMEETGAS